LPKTSSAASLPQRHGCSWPPSSSSLDESQNYDIKHDNYESDSYSHYDEPKTLSYFMQPVCLLNADGGQMISYNMIIVQALRTGWNPHAPNPHKALNRKICETMSGKIFVVVLP
jgi:hypothetical protein